MSQVEEKDFARMMQIIDGEVRLVMGDPQAWLGKALRSAPAPLPWPLAPGAVEGYRGLLAIVFDVCVEMAVDAIDVAEGEHVVQDPTDPDFQMILRVAERAVQHCDKVLRIEFKDLIGPVYGKREFLNKIKAALVERAHTAGGKVPGKIAMTGISRASYYRSLARARKKP